MGREYAGIFPKQLPPAERTVWPCLVHGIIDLHLEMDGLAEATGCGNLQCPIILFTEESHFYSIASLSIPIVSLFISII